MKMKKRTLAILAAAAAVALGSMSIGADAWNGGAGHCGGREIRHDGPMRDGFGPGIRRMEDDLALSAKQKLEMDDMERTWFKDNSDLIRTTAWSLKDYRYDLSAGRNVDENKIAKLREDMVALELGRLDLHRRTYGLLDEDQKKLAERRREEGPFCRRDEIPAGFGKQGDPAGPEVARAENRKIMEAVRDEIHTAMIGNASESDMKNLAEKIVDQRLLMIRDMSKEKFEMRKNMMPRGRGCFGPDFGLGTDR